MRDDDEIKKLLEELHALMIADSKRRPTMLESVRHEKLFEYRKWLNELRKLKPIKIPENCGVTPVPPFNGAIVRFLVRCFDTSETVSVYLDCYDIIGCMDGPYWEIYPYEDDTERYAMDDIDGLSEGIAEAMSKLREQHA